MEHINELLPTLKMRHYTSEQKHQIETEESLLLE